MYISKLTGNKFKSPRMYCKPEDEYFEGEIISNNKQETGESFIVRSNNKEDTLSFFFYVNQHSEEIQSILDYCHNCIENETGDNGNPEIKRHYMCGISVYDDSFTAVIGSRGGYKNLEIDYPIHVNFSDSEEDKKLKEKVYEFFGKKESEFPNMDLFVVSCGGHIFELMDQLHNDKVKILTKSQITIDFLNELDDTLKYSSEFFEEKNIAPKEIKVNIGFINVPILEQFNGQWIFYRHNFDKYRDKIPVENIGEK